MKRSEHEPNRCIAQGKKDIIHDRNNNIIYYQKKMEQNTVASWCKILIFSACIASWDLLSLDVVASVSAPSLDLEVIVTVWID